MSFMGTFSKMPLFEIACHALRNQRSYALLLLEKRVGVVTESLGQFFLVNLVHAQECIVNA